MYGPCRTGGSPLQAQLRLPHRVRRTTTLPGSTPSISANASASARRVAAYGCFGVSSPIPDLLLPVTESSPTSPYSGSAVGPDGEGPEHGRPRQQRRGIRGQPATVRRTVHLPARGTGRCPGPRCVGGGVGRAGPGTAAPAVSRPPGPARPTGAPIDGGGRRGRAAPHQ